MFRRAIVATVLGAVLCAAPPAFANTYTVTAAAGEGGSCTGTDCTSLRAAFAQAGGIAGSQTINLAATGMYALSQGPLAVPAGNHTVTITGPDARLTTIQATGSQVFTVASGTTLQLSALTVSGGSSTQAAGGNISNQGTLNLDRVRVLAGTAPAGGGVANVGGVATITNSLIDDNVATGRLPAGGGILNQASSPSGGPATSTLTVRNSTIVFNHLSGAANGAGIATINPGAQTLLTSVTVARNTADATTGGGAGLYDGTGGNIGAQTVTASIVADNVAGTTTADCGSLKPLASGQNISTSSACGFSTTADPLIDTTYTNQGGQTDVLVTLANSPARRLVTDCPVGADQRGVARTLGGACDAGAYESPQPQPQPQPQPSPQPQPTPIPTPPAPVFHRNVVVTPVSGTVKVKFPGSKTFVLLPAAQNVPLGSTIDVKHGKIELTSVPKPGGQPQTALFYGGIFKLTQPGAITQLQLTEPLAACPRGRAASAAAKKPRTRSLWGDGHGAFRTKGRYSAATVRGTKWFVQDSCAGTLTKVARGVVSVRDDVRHKNITLRAGKRYLAKPRR